MKYFVIVNHLLSLYVVAIHTFHHLSSSLLTIVSAAPSNDLYTNPLTITIGSTIQVNTGGATIEQIDDRLLDRRCYLDKRISYVWYKFSGTSELVVVKACSDNSDTYSELFISGFGNGTTSTLTCTQPLYNANCPFGTFLQTVPGMSYLMAIGTSIPRTVPLSLTVPPPPANDNCTTAIPIKIGSKISLNFEGTTTDIDVRDNCKCLQENMIDNCVASPPSNPGMWLNFTGTGDRVVFQQTTYSDEAIDIAIFTGSTSLCNTSNLACAGFVSVESLIGENIFDSVLGIQYQILVSSPLPIIVGLSIFAGRPPVNDFCVNAIPIQTGSSITTPAALYPRKDTDVVNNCSLTPGTRYPPGIWYKFIGDGEKVIIRSCTRPLCPPTFTISTGGCTNSSHTCVGYEPNPCVDPEVVLGSQPEPFVLQTINGTTYHVNVFVGSNVNEYCQINSRKITFAILPAPTTAPIPVKPALTSSPTRVPIFVRPTPSPPVPRAAPTKVPIANKQNLFRQLFDWIRRLFGI